MRLDFSSDVVVLNVPCLVHGVPLIDTRLSHPTNRAIQPSVSPLFFTANTIEEFFPDPGAANFVPYNLLGQML